MAPFVEQQIGSAEEIQLIRDRKNKGTMLLGKLIVFPKFLKSTYSDFHSSIHILCYLRFYFCHAGNFRINIKNGNLAYCFNHNQINPCVPASLSTDRL